MKNILEHKYTSNILSILTIVIAIVIPIFQTWLTKQGTESIRPVAGKVVIILIVIVAILNIGMLISRLYRNRKIKDQTIIDKLSALQNAYLLDPKYVTSEQHSKDSKEENLSKGGIAEILTNSLKYDMFYSDAIADNIINGAKYIYILPSSSIMLEDLGNYIATISESIINRLNAKKTSGAAEKIEELRLNNLEFWFFSSDISCLYNFAIFRQSAGNGVQPFRQNWWYVNPSDTNPQSHMLSYLIEQTRDQSDLDEVFNSLKKVSDKKNGYDIFANRANLKNYIGEE